MSYTNENIFVIVPAYNEEKFIANVLKKLNFKHIQYIVVDDGSDDKTFLTAKRYAKYVLRHKVNLGKGAALRTGCEYAFKKLNASYVIFLDSDDQHDVEEIDLFTEKIKNGAQMILGVRTFGADMPLIRIMGNRLASFLVFLLFGKYIPDIPSGYKAMSKSVYSRLKLTSCDYRIELEIAVKLAKYNIKFETITIKTIYHEMNRGFQVLDSFKMIFYLLQWRLSL
jgi:glycosyltransferase involved in cell wall biosynthesis